AASPVLGGYIQEQFGWRENFLFLFLFGLLIWGLMCAVVPETNQHLNPEATKLRVMMKNYWILLNSNVFLGYTLCACFTFAGIVAYITIAPFLFQNTLGLSPLEFGQLTFFTAGAICFSGVVNSFLVMRKGIAYMVGVGALCMIVSGFSMLLLAFLGKLHVLNIMIPMTLFSLGAGFTFINAFAGAFHPFPKMAGMAGALYASMQDLTAACSSGLIAAAKVYSMQSLAIILLLLSVASLAAWYFLAIQPDESRGEYENN
ncbi:MAG: MFS transporter, partial [Legionella sp.]